MMTFDLTVRLLWSLIGCFYRRRRVLRRCSVLPETVLWTLQLSEDDEDEDAFVLFLLNALMDQSVCLCVFVCDVKLQVRPDDGDEDDEGAVTLTFITCVRSNAQCC